MSTVAIGLAIDVYSPTNDAGGIAQIAGMSHHICEKTNALYAAGNITATIGKELTIGSVTLVSWPFLVRISNASISTIDELNPNIFIGLIVGVEIHTADYMNI
jgi:Na+/H+-translocating membrane pyrophosphatase